MSSDNKFWPYKPKNSIVSAIVTLIALLIIFGILRSTISWPSDASTNTTLLGILLLSLLPILLSILDTVIDRGGTIGYKDFKIDFSKAQKSELEAFKIPVNIGTDTLGITKSAIQEILKVLGESASVSIAIINLKDGLAWWDTRLFLLLAGAKRLGNLNKIVFVATIGNVAETFIGWAYTNSLFKCLLKRYPEFFKAYINAKTVSSQRDLINLTGTDLNSAILKLRDMEWMSRSAMENLFIPEYSTVDVFEEQVLQDELGTKIEANNQAQLISVNMLKTLFASVLITESIDENWTSERQREALVISNSNWMAITKKGKYSSLISKASILEEMIKQKAK